jgi:protein-ribulosamine 3-kinase
MTGLPPTLREPVESLLRGLGDPAPVQSARPLGGGCINNAARLETARGPYLLKWNANPLPGMFQAEASGLELLASTQTVRVPAVLGHSEPSASHPAFILLEWLEAPPGSRSSSGDQAWLGEQMAELHRWQPPNVDAPAYGLDHDNYLGSSRQLNGWEKDWAEFFVRYRIRPQQQLAIQNGRMPTRRMDRLDRLCQRLPDLFAGVERLPSLIHGDLWGGNILPGPTGLSLIDPAVSFSDREAEIAYTELFGGFSTRFYEAYHHALPLDTGYAQRRDLYNLYHLLNHLNLFGESYGGQVDSILQRYTG